MRTSERYPFMRRQNAPAAKLPSSNRRRRRRSSAGPPAQAIDCLERAYVRDDLTTDELADRVAIAHWAEAFEELDAAIANVRVV
jgi:hypothetical protein